MDAKLIVHCDWSTSEKKRWLCSAEWRDDGFHVSAPRPVGALANFFRDLREREPTGGVLCGFDFPIGLPRAYAARARVRNFREALCQFGEGRFSDFYEPAKDRWQISLMRPFFPFRPGGTRKQHLIDGLGLACGDELFRECERASAGRSSACEMFWTLGAKQVGKAAICGWRELLAPALRRNEISLWPFEGDLTELLKDARIVAAETYPAEIYSHLQIPARFGKSRQEGRSQQAGAILGWCEGHRVVLEADLESAIQEGFGPRGDGEDEFDSFVGLLGMVEVMENPEEFGVPDDQAVREIEGWILGKRL